MIGLNKIGLNQVQLNQLYLNTLCACKKSSGGDGFPRLPGDVTRWSFKGLTNEQMSKNPRLEDADHKGRFLTFKNFAWSGMSGCNAYHYDFTSNSKWKHNESRADIGDITENSFVIKKLVTFDGTFVFWSFTDPLYQGSYYIRITGLDTVEKGRFVVASADVEGKVYNTYIEKDGIYKIDSYKRKNSESAIGYSMHAKGSTNCNIKVEILPIYPDALVFDGVDDYGICENFPILTKEKGYTVVALRKWLTPEDKANNEVLVANLKEPRWITENWGAFGCEVKYNNVNPKVKRTMSFGNTPVINVNENNVLLCQTSNNYNGVDIVSGNNTSGPYLLICSGGTSFFAKAAIWELIILDHDATEEELTKIKNYFIKTYPWLFFDQAWTVTGKTNEDTDRATIANITGNGNNLVLSNFGFAGNSGYGEYAYNWSTWRINKVDSTKSNVYHNRMEITLPAIGESSRTQCNFYSPLCEVGTIYDFSFKISGLTDNSVVLVKPGTNGGGAVIAQYNKDGVYHLNYTLTDEAIIDESTQNRIYFFIQNFSDEEMNLTVEQIPNHGSYLVTDGVDDMIVSSVFGMGKDFTIVGDWKFIGNKKSGTGLAKGSSFYIYNTMTGLDLYINSSSVKNSLDGIKSINAACSDGRAYDRNWNEILANTGNVVGSGGTLEVSSSGGRFDRIAFKNLAIYPRILSKDDCIKAYNYLQTLKAK